MGRTVEDTALRPSLTAAAHGALGKQRNTFAPSPSATKGIVPRIAEAKAKTDRIDAAALARLHAAGYLPEVWQPDERTELLRNLVSRRATIVQGMTRTKNRIHAVLHANLIPPFSGKLCAFRSIVIADSV